MSTLRHPNILGFLGLCLLPPCLVSEYCPRGSLYDILREARTSQKLASQLTWARRLSIVRGNSLRSENYLVGGMPMDQR